MRVIGFCRFSYPGPGGFKRMHDSVAEREAFLYAPERMELRFRHFEALTLPCIAAQTDPEFTFLVQIGESLPDRYQQRLFDLTMDIPQIRIVAQPPIRQREAARIAIKEELAEDKTGSIQFRLDDDDAVAVDFVARIRKLAQASEGLFSRGGGVVFEFNRGYAVRLSAAGISAEKVTPAFWSCGLAAAFKPGHKKTILNYAHHKMHLELPTVIQPVPAMFLRAVHEDNDSSEKIRPGKMHPLSDEERALFEKRFNVSDAQVSRVFSRRPVFPGRA